MNSQENEASTQTFLSVETSTEQQIDDNHHNQSNDVIEIINESSETASEQFQIPITNQQQTAEISNNLCEPGYLPLNGNCKAIP